MWKTGVSTLQGQGDQQKTKLMTAVAMATSVVKRSKWVCGVTQKARCNSASTRHGRAIQSNRVGSKQSWAWNDGEKELNRTQLVDRLTMVEITRCEAYGGEGK